jgi:SAM-dependent methyltransferase
MTQTTTGLRRVLSQPDVYELWSRLVGADRSRRVLIREHVRPWPGARVLDLGCGPGDLVHYLGDVRYVGLDISEAYIERARRVYGGRAEFQLGDATCLDDDLVNFDLALAFGVLHHLDDAEARALFRSAAGALAPGGRLVAVDPALTADQHAIARFLIARDRGRNIRSPSQYEKLAEEVLSESRFVVRHDLLRIPYTHCVIEARA